MTRKSKQRGSGDYGLLIWIIVAAPYIISGLGVALAGLLTYGIWRWIR